MEEYIDEGEVLHPSANDAKDTFDKLTQGLLMADAIMNRFGGTAYNPNATRFSNDTTGPSRQVHTKLRIMAPPNYQFSPDTNIPYPQ